MRRLLRLPRGLLARLALVLVAALLIEFGGNALLTRVMEREVISEERFRALADHLASAAQVAGHVEPARRPQLMDDMTTDGMGLNWGARTVIGDAGATDPQLARVRDRLVGAAAGLARHDMRVSLIPSGDGRRDLLGAVRLADGSFVTFRIHPFLSPAPSSLLISALHLLLLALVLGIALAMIRALVRPLDDLAAAADATGKGARADIPLAGPSEVRRVALAFRAMQARLYHAMEDHTAALIAVSHDLRTPIQRARLRIGGIDDAELRGAVTADLVDMEKFIASVATFIQSGEEEAPKLVDLAAMAMTMVDDAVDAGCAVDYEGPDALAIRLQPLAMKRALANLVENACRHGTRVRVVLDAGPPVAVRVDDDGPGIPPERREDMFLPFQRIDAQRGSHDGSGLGLAIVKNAAATLGATALLGDSAWGGLSATITLPMPAEDGAVA